MLHSLWNRHFRSSRKRPAATGRRRRSPDRSSRLRFEVLEDRTVFSTTPLFFNGFEVNTFGWDTSASDSLTGPQFNVTRVPSGTNGIPSSTGGFHGQVGQFTLPQGGSAFTPWGASRATGYSTTFPDDGYRTSVDIYLNVGAGYANDTRFNWLSSISGVTSTGGIPDHRRDFVFDVGFYNSGDVTGPGAGTNRFIISAKTNSGRAGAFPKDPNWDPIAVSTSGWYRFVNVFQDDGNGNLVAKFELRQQDGTLVHSWTPNYVGKATDVIGVTVGGNHSGWFASNEFPFLAVDNTLKTGCVDHTYVNDNFANPQFGADPDGPGPATIFGVDSFATIQEAVDATCANGLVDVYAGTYVEEVTITRAVTINGVEGQFTAVLACPEGVGITVVAPANASVHLNNLKITGCDIGIDVFSGCVLVTNSYITGNNVGAQLEAGGGGVLVMNCNEISGNGIGVRNFETNYAVNAINNYWGSPLGPTGGGNTVGTVGLVDSSPWATSLAACANPTAYAGIDGNGNLVVNGTNAADNIDVNATNLNNVVVKVGGIIRYSGPVAAGKRAIIYGHNGGDVIKITGALAGEIYGGAGNDNITGSSLKDLLHGGAGNDVLAGNEGDDILIGGAGSDIMTAGSGNDMLIGGDFIDPNCLTFNDNQPYNYETLCAILLLWTTYFDVPGQIPDLADGQLADDIFDNARDTMTGGSGRDWFLGNFTGPNADITTDFLAGFDYKSSL